MRGQTVGKYRIEEVLGQGGMGTVYLAQHTVIGKRAAVKLLRGELGADDEVVQRFFNEARAAARIEHPGIIDVYDFGRHQGAPYLVMELLDGEPLSARMARGPIGAAEVERIARQIAAALAAAHEHGIAHRDLKPDNIFLVPDAAALGGTRVKLLDFGIAKLAEPDGSSSVETRTGAVIGTPVYMAPEQCAGTGKVDHRADLYALGCILYQMIAGRPPFARKGVGELISAHMTEQPEPIEERAERVEPRMAALVMRLLEKDPRDRPANASDVIRALDGTEPSVRRMGAPAPGAHLATLLPDDDVDTHPMATSPSELATAETAYESAGHPATQSTLSAAAAERPADAPQPSRSGRWATAAAALLIAGAGAGVWAFTQRDAGETGEPDEAAATAPADRIDANLREPRLGLAHLEGFRTASGSKGTLFTQPGGWRSAAADFEEARRQPGAPVRWSAAAELSAGYAALYSGQVDEGLLHMRRAVELDDEWAPAHLGLAGALSKHGESEAALAAARRAEQLDPDWWLPVAELAGIHRRADDLERAVEEYQRALTKAPGEPLILSGLALLYHAMHMDSAAAEFAEKALAADPDMLSSRLLLAERALEEGDGETALEHAERILARQPRSAPAKLAQADALLALKQRGDARAAFERALELRAENGSQGGPDDRFAAVRKALDRDRLPRPRHWRQRSKSRHSRSKKDRSDNMLDDPLNGLEGL